MDDQDLHSTRPINDDGQAPIEPDDSLKGYQDELETDDRDDEAMIDQAASRGTLPTQETLLPEDVLREELDALAIDENSPGDMERDEDRREHIEDMDENDKPA